MLSNIQFCVGQDGNDFHLIVGGKPGKSSSEKFDKSTGNVTGSGDNFDLYLINPIGFYDRFTDQTILAGGYNAQAHEVQDIVYTFNQAKNEWVAEENMVKTRKREMAAVAL